MGQFSNNCITESGRLLLADAQTGGEFYPTKVVMGSGYIPSGKTARTMTDVVSSVKDLAINKLERTNDGKVIIGGVYTNEDITTAFYFRELALYAKVVWRDGNADIIKESEEKLYSYGNAGASADLMPAYSTSTVVEKQIDLVTYVGNDTAVNLTIESGVYLTVEELEKQLNKKNYQSAIKDADLKDVPVDADSVALVDSADNNATKRLTWAKLKATLKAFFDTLYASATHSHAWGAITGKPTSFTPTAHKSSHVSGGSDAISPSDIGAATSQDIATSVESHNSDPDAHSNQFGEKLNKTGDGSNVTAVFSQASTRANIGTGESLKVILGKVSKFFYDLKTVAFSGSYSDLSNKPQAGVDFAAASHSHSGTYEPVFNVLSVGKGGTGANTAEGARTNLAISDATIPISNDVATALGLDPADDPQVKDALLTINALANSKAKIVTGSYTGTGTYGSDNPNRLTFGFEPYFIAFFTESGNLRNASSNKTLDNGKQLAGLVTMLTTNYQVGTFPYSHYDSGGRDYYSHSKMSEDRKTLYWYSSGSAGYQYNSSGTIYYYLAIG